eukprot:1803567-Prymnesium_polylepis.1
MMTSSSTQKSHEKTVSKHALPRGAHRTRVSPGQRTSMPLRQTAQACGCAPRAGVGVASYESTSPNAAPHAHESTVPRQPGSLSHTPPQSASCVVVARGGAPPELARCARLTLGRRAAAARLH